jgi:hypothetical protein
LDAKQRRVQIIAPLSMAAIFLLSIGIAYLNADAAKFFLLLILPTTMITNKGDSTHKLHEAQTS